MRWTPPAKPEGRRHRPHSPQLPESTNRNDPEATHGAPDAPVHRVRHPGDDARRARARGAESGPGIPRFSGAAGRQGCRLPRHPAKHQPVRDHLGIPALPRRAGAEVPRVVRDGGERRARDHCHLRSHRGDGVHHAGDHQPGGRGDRAGAVLRELWAGRDPVRRHPDLPSAAAAGLPPGRGGAGSGGHPAHARHHPEHTQQPHRARLQPPGAGGRRRYLPAPRYSGLHRRDLRAHLLRGRAHSAGHSSRDARSHRHRLGGFQDLQRHRLAAGHHRGPRRPHQRDPQGARLPDRGRSGAAAGRGWRWR